MILLLLKSGAIFETVSESAFEKNRRLILFFEGVQTFLKILELV